MPTALLGAMSDTGEKSSATLKGLIIIQGIKLTPKNAIMCGCPRVIIGVLSEKDQSD